MFCSRQQHFFQFLQRLELDVSLKSFDLATQTLIAIVYLCWLADGNTIKDMQVRKTSLQGYMSAVRDYSLNVCGRDICLDPDPNAHYTKWKQHRMLDYVYDYQKKIDGRKRKKEPITKRLIQYMIDKNKEGNPNRLAKALIDWLILGLTTGYRGVEWCQEHNPMDIVDGKRRGFRTYDIPVPHTDNRIYAKCREDWIFYDAERTPIRDPLNVDPNRIAYTSDWYRYQKDSNKNNTTVFYASTHDQWCPTRAKLNILRRHIELDFDKDTPLAVYNRNYRSIFGSYITRASATRHINEAGKAVYGHIKHTKGNPWTLHSIRIGATALLYARHRDVELLQLQLRWDSEKWREYIRFTPILAALQAKAIIDVDTDDIKPDFKTL